MPYDFAKTAIAARERIPVPAVPMESIRGLARSASARERTRRLILCGAIGLASIGAAAGAAKIYDGVHIWLSGGKAAVVIRSFGVVTEPMALDLQNIVASASFPVVFPVGLPEGTRVKTIMFAPAAHPSVIYIQYQNHGAKFNSGFYLLASAAITKDRQPALTTGSAFPADATKSSGPVDRWEVGKETVLAVRKNISAAHESRIKTAMMNASQSDSVAATQSMLRRIVVLGGSIELADEAERYAPSHGPSVLLDRGHLKSLAALIAQAKPMLDSRTVHLTDIPQVNGNPEYMKATYHWQKKIAIAPQGLRAIDAVLRSSGQPGDACGCEVLFNQPNDATYWVWKIPMSSPRAVQKYAVDAKSFEVKPLNGAPRPR